MLQRIPTVVAAHMPAHQQHITDPANIQAVLGLYRQPTCPSTYEIGAKLNLSYHTVCYILKHNLSEEEFTILKRLRYSRTKLGDLNPMKGKSGEKHHRWKGDCDDGYGYRTRKLADGKRYFVHRIIFAEAMGLHPSQLPPSLDLHHIDENPLNNSLDNLALCTRLGHKRIHERMKQDSDSLRLKKSSLKDALRFIKMEKDAEV